MTVQIKKVSVNHIQNIAHGLATKTMSWNEPIPEFETRYPNVLESCLSVPFQQFEQKIFYAGLVGKASILFYLLIKNHPFQNGNKRIAVTTLLIFLYLNEKWLRVSIQELYNTARWVAASPPQAKNEVVKYLEKFIKSNLVEKGK